MNLTTEQMKAEVDAANVDLNEIRPGDRVTIFVPAGRGRNGQEWSERTGRAVMRSFGAGWVLNLGGKYGTPGVAVESNTLRVKKARKSPNHVTTL